MALELHPAAARSLFVARKAPLTRYFLLSLGGHAAVVGALLLFSHLIQPAPMDLNQTPIKASLVRLGKPRDQKLLPRKEEAAPPPPKEEKGQTAPVPEPPPNAVALPGQKPTDVKKQQQAGVKESTDRRKQLFGAFDKANKDKKAEELEGALDGDALGDSATQEGERYYGMLTSLVKRNYDVSQTLSDQERLHLRAQVGLRVGRRGEVVKVVLAKSSGNDLFDSAVIAAVKRAAPFSPPPDHLREKLQSQGVVLEFRP